MPLEDFRAEVGGCWSIASVPLLLQRFGSSYEAATFRLASANPGVAAAGLLKFRLRKEEERALRRQQTASRQQQLFPTQSSAVLPMPAARYRRQSFHVSESFPLSAYVHWNKSFDDDSIVYRTPEGIGLLAASESLPSANRRLGILEAVTAPFQRPDADPQHPDLLFFWSAA